ncbi:MAG: acyl-CoA/acyl-ACP dehydrogenase, partial [Acetobacteraceae bacterium]|nr:acyl-CoA/acyl-ACP dehydrogenase [Acetobacteraceae bacterium]
MEFALTLEQRQFDDSLRSFLADRLPMEHLRAITERGDGFDAPLWEGLGELGLLGLLAPERLGGAGLDVLDAAVAAEALGHAAAPVPFTGAAMAVLALTLSGSQALQDEYVPRIASGEARFAVAFARLAGQTGAAHAVLEGDRLSGQIAAVMDAGAATHLLVYLPDGTAALAETAAMNLRMHRSVDRTRPVTDTSFENVPAQRLDAANQPLAAAKRVLDAGRVLLAADTLGAAQRMLDRAVAFAKERVQFGRVVGSFQGVKYMLADCVTMLEPCRALVWHAAYAQDALPDEARLMACHAKAHLGDIGREVARITTEVHGGMGFTDLLGLHYWF